MADTKSKYRGIPTLAMVKRNQPKIGTKEWIDRIATAHGSTRPERLEHRRRGISAYLGLIENTMKQMQAWKKEFQIETEAREKEVLGNVKSAEAALDKAKDDAAKAQALAEKQKWEQTQKQLVYEYRAQMLNFNAHISQVQYQLCAIESWTLMIDHLGIRVKVKGKKSKKEGTIRYSVASFMFDASSVLCDIYEMLLSLHPQLAEAAAGAEEPEAEDEEVMTDEEADRHEAAKRKKLEGA